MTDHVALRVAGNDGDTVEVTTPGWTQIADRSIDGKDYRAYLYDSATLLIDTDIAPIIA